MSLLYVTDSRLRDAGTSVLSRYLALQAPSFKNSNSFKEIVGILENLCARRNTECLVISRCLQLSFNNRIVSQKFNGLVDAIHAEYMSTINGNRAPAKFRKEWKKTRRFRHKRTVLLPMFKCSVLLWGNKCELGFKLRASISAGWNFVIPREGSWFFCKWVVDHVRDCDFAGVDFELSCDIDGFASAFLYIPATKHLSQIIWAKLFGSERRNEQHYDDLKDEKEYILL